MKLKIITAFIFITILLFTTACIDNNALEITGSEYLGQNPPGDSAEVFAPGIVSTGMNERDLAISPEGDEIYFTVRFGGSAAIVETHIENDKWIDPEVAWFSGEFMDIEPFIAPDGKTFYFVSERPIEGGEKPSENTNIWFMKKTEEGWSKPLPLGEPVNGNGNVYYPTVAKSGNLYFTRRMEDGTEYIYRAKYKDGKFDKPERLPENVNTTNSQFNAYISPDEDFLIIPVYGRDDSFGSSDYYISYRDSSDNWSELVNLGEKVNSPFAEYTPSLSPDGKYFFFQQNSAPVKFYNKPVTYEAIQKIHNNPANTNTDIYWIKADFLRELK